jgi:large exoprotein involved in heme utilization and adhesion
VSLKVEATGGITGGNITITGPDTTLVGSDPDIPILTSGPALILRAGLTTLENPVADPPNQIFQVAPGQDQAAGGATFTIPSSGYALSTIPLNFENLSAATTLNLRDDQVSDMVPLPFSFNYFGTDYTSIYVSSNGFITPVVTGNNGCCDGSALPSTSGPNATIAGWWTDLNPSNGGTISYGTISDASGNQRFIVQFNDVPRYISDPSAPPNPVTMQFQLIEGTNTIEVHYLNAPIDADGFPNINSAGIENQDGTLGLQFLSDATTALNSTAVRYTPTAANTNSISVGNINTSYNPTYSTDNFNSAGGPVILDAVGDITIRGNINSSSPSNGGGTVTITSSGGGITLNGGLINSSGGFGQGGAITLDANRNVVVENSRIRSNSKGDGTTAGAISITGNSVSLTNSELDAGALGNGSGGNVVLTTLNGGSVLLDGSTILSDTPSIYDSSQGGQINITAGSVSLKNNSLLDASTRGQAQGGSVSVTTDGGIALDNSSIRSTVALGAGGSGGSIAIQGSSVSLTNGGRLEARTLGDRTLGSQTPIENNARAGNITVNVTGSDFIDPVLGTVIPAFNASGFSSQEGFSSGLYTSSEQENSGRGGDITVNALNGTAKVSEAAVLSARNEGNSSGGLITVNAQNLEVLSGGQIIATASGIGDAADIDITALGSVTISGYDVNFANRPSLSLDSDRLSGSGTLDEVEGNNGNDSIATAQAIAGIQLSDRPLYFSGANDTNIESSTTIPHISISGTGNGTFDYYQFNAHQGDIGIFDIDNTSNIDTQLFLFSVSPDGRSTRLLQDNDDSPTLRGGSGSSSGLDSYIRTRLPFQQTGSYIIGVSQYYSTASDAGIDASSGVPAAGSSYTLQVSLGPDVITNAGLVPNQGSSSGLYARSEGTGAGGNVTIRTGQLAIQNGAEVSASTAGFGPGGTVTVDAMNGGSVSVDNASISTAIQAGVAGSSSDGVGGDINIIGAGSISLTNRASLDASTNGQGIGGSISVSTVDGGSLTLVGSSISTAVRDTPDTAEGNGGSIDISAGSISLTGGSRLEALTFGSGDAGDIHIAVSDQLDISGANQFGGFSGLLTSSEGAESGAGGDIRINTADNPQGILRVSDGGFLSARTTGSSPGGAIEVNVRELEVVNGGQLITSGSSSGRAGDMSVNATDSTTISGSNPNFNPDASTSNTSSGGSGLLDEIESNDSISGAQLIDPSFFSLASNFNIESSTTIPHVSISGTGDGTFDYYSFEVTTLNSSGIFDIDNGFQGEAPSSIDTQLFLFDQSGQLLASNDDSSTLQGAGGSNSVFDTYTYDSYIQHTFTSPGTYIIGVGRYFSSASNGSISGDAPVNPQTYNLQVSINDPNLNPNRNFNPNQSANSGLFAQATGGGEAGKLTITTGQLLANNEAQVSVSSNGTGIAGDLEVIAGNVLVDNGTLSAQTEAGAGGNITLQGLNTLQLSNSSEISASTQTGQAGSVSINENENPAELVQVSGNSRLSAQANEGNGSAGTLTINTRALMVEDESEVSASTIAGVGGSITLQGLNTLQLSNSSEISASTQTGRAGSVSVNENENPAELVQVSGNSRLSTQANEGNGSAGSLTINTRALMVEDESEVSASTIAGVGGNITLQGLNTLQLSNSSEISASTQTGQAGSVSVNENENPAESVQVSGNSRLSTQANEGNGSAGSLRINTRALTVREGAEVSASTVAGISRGIRLQGLNSLQVSNSTISASTVNGLAGILSVNANENPAELVELSGSGGLSLAATGTGSAGNLTINARALVVRDGAQISAETQSGEGSDIRIQGLNTLQVSNSAQISASTRDGQAGNLSINVNENPAELVELSGSGGLSLAATGTGSAGNLTINTRNLMVRDGAQISAETNSGQGRDIRLQGLNTLQVSNGSISASTRDGQAGNLSINVNENPAESVELSGSGGLSLAATGTGSAGNLTINTRNLMVRDGAQISAETNSGEGRDIRLQGLNTLQVSNGSISASTRDGQAGNLSINVNENPAESVELSGSGGLSLAATGTGSAGNLTINTRALTVRDGAQISAETNSGEGRDIRLQGLNTLQVSNGSISASTRDGQAGNLSINVNENPAESVELSGSGGLSLAATGTGSAGT